MTYLTVKYKNQYIDVKIEKPNTTLEQAAKEFADLFKADRKLVYRLFYNDKLANAKNIDWYNNLELELKEEEYDDFKKQYPRKSDKIPAKPTEKPELECKICYFKLFEC